ncbi:hypothetical protein [Marivita sp. XM-24bin2]|uniref:hypothetical protein n=1 Tax=unclassified Marivita TaxID=2632480 RepID=UPI000D7947E2|nr:hypothetical protein [Marivita sp. XM-24bin2]MCR9109478.1 hypothetical protein [Paracoccaceae bacterium]PWL35727.1 MAG: hypothetical protein DCO97_08120 [Marivita sp. XM-24bin2]
MSKPSIAVTGDGQLFGVWITHGMKRFPMATFYDQSATVTAFRQAEVELGRRGLLDPAGQAAARRTAENLANPPDFDVTLTFKGPVENGIVKVKCKNGREKTFEVRLTGIDDRAISQGFHNVDAAVTRCLAGPHMTQT